MTEDQMKEIISHETGFEWLPGELMPMSGDELLRIAIAIAALAAKECP